MSIRGTVKLAGAIVLISLLRRVGLRSWAEKLDKRWAEQGNIGE